MDAVGSGKKFSRIHWEHWLTHESYEWGLKAEDILANDWEVEPTAKQKVTMWQAVFKTKLDNFYIPEGLFKDEYEASKYNVGFSFVKLVNPVEIEI